ncbi:hypothetical protein pipiens_008785 [Culex pipiens pipiens]|uniref:Msta n=1 Tax=Culex pipiens pipiens TaxID=38569 RepID=A0ABD1DG44_CULPP
MSAELYKVLECPEMGRYGVASRDLRAGEIAYEDTPFAIGPSVGSAPLCLECACPVDGCAGGARCPRCGWPLCEECGAEIEASVYHKAECELFAKHGVKFQNVEDSSEACVQLDCITPLRVLLAKEANPDRWNAEIVMMEDHRAERDGNAFWKADQSNVVAFLRDSCGLKDRCSEELIQKAIGILDVNAFEAHTCSLRGLYPKMGIMAHSCVTNVAHTVHPSKGYRLIARAAVEIEEGAMLCTTYTHLLAGIRTRQAELQRTKYFTCQCKRCLDPTELGIHFSSMKCQKCDNGLVESTKPTDEEAEWKCTHCEHKLKGALIAKAIQVMQAEIDELAYMEYGPERLGSFERVFKKYRSLLHPLHFINTSIRHSLIELYGRIPGYMMPELPDILLERKIELCKDILRVIDVFEPGKSRSRAMLLYELHAPIVVLAQSEFSQGSLGGEPLKKRLQEAVQLLEECTEMLEWEDPTTPEGTLADVAKQSLVQLKRTVQVLP